MRNTRRAVFVLLLAVAGCRNAPKVCPPGYSPDGRARSGTEVWCRGTSGRLRWVELYPASTNRKQMCPFSGGVPDGTFTAWHPDGTTFVEGDYRAGLKHGYWMQWNGTGLKVAEGQYQEGRLIQGAPVGIAAHCEEMKP